MRFVSLALQKAAPLLAIVACFALGAAPAGAKGTVLILHANGTSNVYHDSVIKIIHNALFVTSADGAGTFVVHKAACSYQGDLMVCFPTSAALVQSGSTKPLDLRTGTIYVNMTDDYQPMPMTTAKVAPHSIVVSFTTYKGTYCSLKGRIDEVVQ